MINILIDESGTLPDPKDKFIVICGVLVKQIKKAENIFSRVLNSLKLSKISLSEIKFYRAGNGTKKQFLSDMVLADFKMFVLIVDKKERKINDSPENYGILIADIMNEIMLWQKSGEMNFILDKHFCREADQNRLNDILKEKIKNKLQYKISHVDSEKNCLVNIADMAAGAVLRKYNKNDSEFYGIIKENIIVEKIINWPEIKKESKIKQKFT